MDPVTLASQVDLGLAESALNAPAAGVGDHELYPGLLRKAAVLCTRLCRASALPCGNLCVAFECLRAFLDENGVKWTASNSDIVAELMGSVEAGRCDEHQLTIWLEQNVTA
jgi:prophage maintenance system killer protein